jgi:hypothetical protein
MAKEPLSFVVDESDPPEYTRLAVGTEGYSPVDLRDLVTRTIQVAVGRAVSEVGVGVEKVGTGLMCMFHYLTIIWEGYTFSEGFCRGTRRICTSLTEGCALTKVGHRVG